MRATLSNLLVLTLVSIKKAYRRKALELHPDRNYGNVEDSTRLFAEIQTAYEVLSEPQERAWYDSHHGMLFDSGGEAAEEHYQRSVKVTTAEDIIRMCLDRSAFLDFSDSPSGFFTKVRGVFDRLALEEAIACEMDDREPITHPTFGSASDSYEDVAQLFYSTWSNFATRKSFAWKDAYRYSEASDRRTRRLMEKENKKLRDDSIKEFNDAVRTMVAFVKKRDPRYEPSSQTDAERIKSMRSRVAAQAAKARAANREKLASAVVPEWARSDPVVEQEKSESSDDEPQEHFECIICQKTFKSENQYQAHEKSKKHTKAANQVRREMQRQNATLNLESEDKEQSSLSQKSETHGDENLLAQRLEGDLSLQDGYDDSGEIEHLLNAGAAQTDSGGTVDLKDQSEDSSSGGDEEYAPRSEIEERISGRREDSVEELAKRIPTRPRSSDDVSRTSKSATGKVGKAKARRTKKAAKEANEHQNQNIRCATCHVVFPSKTKLFHHISDEPGHATPMKKITKGGREAVRR